MRATPRKKPSLSVLKRCARDYAKIVGRNYPYTSQGETFTERDTVLMFRRMPMILCKVNNKWQINMKFKNWYKVTA